MPNLGQNKIAVKLIKSFNNPAKNIAACAKTCYSSKGIITDDQINFPKDEVLIHDIFKAGHHTNFEHAYFQFGIQNVSRQTVWSFLHSHRFYNSEEVSQRYTEVKENFFYLPNIDNKSKKIFVDTIKLQYAYYKKLIDLLTPKIKKEYFSIFPEKEKHITKYENNIKRKCMEVARYILPIGAFTYLYHTVNLITIIRYYFSLNENSSEEEIDLVNGFLTEIYNSDPNLKKILAKIFKEKETQSENLNKNILFSKSRKVEFDNELGGLSSKLVDYIHHAEKTLADSVRLYYGKSKEELNDSAALDYILNPARNRVLSKSLVLTHNDNLNRSLNHVKYVFKKKISHSADSQNQRHRTIPSSKSDLNNEDFYDPDYIVPSIVKNISRICEEYDNMMTKIWKNIQILLDSGIDKKKVLYLLPNAYPIRMIESGSLLNYHHKFTQRLCYNAQEEIWNNSIDEVKQISLVHPEIGKYLLPPCSLRFIAKINPVCLEGKRFCGIKVWNLKVEDYERLI